MNTDTDSGNKKRRVARFFLPFLLLCAAIAGCSSLPAAPKESAAADTIRLSPENDTEMGNPNTEPPVPAETQLAPSTKKSITEVTIEAQSETALPKTRMDPATGGIILTVGPGDTLSNIARTYKVRVSDLIAWNTLADPDDLPVGYTLFIREPGSASDLGEISAPETESTGEILDNTAYGWSYPAGTDVESLINRFHAYSRIPYPHQQLMLTFDCGYSYQDFTSRILDTLSEKNVKATFFITGSFLEQEPDTVLRMVKEGHQIGNHTMMHLNPTQILDSENPASLHADIRELEEALEKITGSQTAKLLRPPEGNWSMQTLALYQDLGYTTLFWDLTYRDWETDNQMPEDEALHLLTEQTHDGAIILLHTVSETNTKILGNYIDEMQNKDYTFVLPAEIFQ